MVKNSGIAFAQIVAALLVVNFHTKVLDIPILSKFAVFGFILTTTFVFLSGFLLARSLVLNPDRSYREFMFSRFSRIYPSFHISLLLIAMIYLLIGYKFSIASFLLSVTGFAFFFRDFTFGEHLWFVSVIVTCYLLCLPTYYALKRFPVLFLLSLLCISLLIIYSVEGAFDGVYSKTSAGVLYRFLYNYIVFSVALYIGINRDGLVEWLAPWKWVGVFAVLFPLYIWLQPQSQYGLWAIASVFVIALCVIQILFMLTPMVEEHAPQVFYLSAITYEIYLVHYVVIDAVNLYFHGEYFAFPLVFIVSIALAWVVYHLAKFYTKALEGWMGSSSSVAS